MATFEVERRSDSNAESEVGSVAEARHLLGNCVLFRGLSIEERCAIAARARIRILDAGETVFATGDPGDHMMALLSGTIRISVQSSEGKELLLAMIQCGEVFGELAVLDGRERSADAVAESVCTLAMLHRRDIFSFFERNPSAWPKLVQVLCQRLRCTDEVLADIALLPLPARLAKTILRASSTKPGQAREARVRLNQRDLASMVGATRESVNKCLHTWQYSGIVQVSHGLLTITNSAALAEIAGGLLWSNHKFSAGNYN